MGERSDQDYHGYGHRLDWARNQKPKRPKEDFAEIEGRSRSLKSMGKNPAFTKGESALRTQFPLFVRNSEGDFERTYTGILAQSTQGSETVALFTRAGMDPRGISCKSDFFPDVTTLDDLTNAVTEYRNQHRKIHDLDPIHQANFKVKLTAEQLQGLKSHYENLRSNGNEVDGMER
jgi:hypothetical protein